MNTILFDLDGTLLPLDMEEFTQGYFAQLATKLSDHINPKDLPKIVWTSTKHMVKDTNKDKTNMEAFFEDFKTRIDTDLEDLHPLFPKEAIYHRIKWAGLEPDDFELVTTYEGMHYCKPHLEYYEEILELIDKEPNDVMMVGNNVDEDIVASKLGIKTYLIEDYKIDSGNNDLTPDYKGSLEDFYQFVKEL